MNPGLKFENFIEKSLNGAAELKASFRAGEKRRFASETPKERRFSKTDLAKYVNAWDGLPHQVSFGNQKNFQYFIQAVKDQHPEGFLPDETWYRAFVAKAIVFRAAQAIVKARKFPAYQANIVAYTVAALSWACGGRIDFERVWAQQSISESLRAMIDRWVVDIDRHLRESANTRMPSEWAKKAECWQALRDLSLELPDPLPPELQAQQTTGRPGREFGKRNDGLSREDLEMIERCRRVDAATWFKVARWGSASKAIHWKVAGIAKTVGEYAIGGWERSPSAKQAKWAIEAFDAAQSAGVV